LQNNYGKYGVLKIVHGSLVVMKGIRHRSLYPLIGETVTGDLVVGISRSNDQTECTRIWHMRLGHMSEKGLSLLCGKGLFKNMKKPCMEFCEHCVYGKAHRLKFSTSEHKTRGLLECILMFGVRLKLLLRVLPDTLLHLLMIILGMLGFTFLSIRMRYLIFSSVGKQWLKTEQVKS